MSRWYKCIKPYHNFAQVGEVFECTDKVHTLPDITVLKNGKAFHVGADSFEEVNEEQIAQLEHDKWIKSLPEEHFIIEDRDSILPTQEGYELSVYQYLEYDESGKWTKAVLVPFEVPKDCIVVNLEEEQSTNPDEWATYHVLESLESGTPIKAIFQPISKLTEEIPTNTPAELEYEETGYVVEPAHKGKN